MIRSLIPLLLITLFTFSVIFPQQTFAIEDPLARPNNKIGIHLLFDSELPQAAQLVNSSGGDWGYILLPIQSHDKDLIKWQKVMDEAKKYHLIPIIRLATEGDYFNTKVWRKPRPQDIMDFANFLDSLDWPVKNRYVIVFNEVNRGDEWGGAVNPAEYAELLSFAVTVFKSKTPDFFVISAGMDNAAPTRGTEYLNQYEYLRQMHVAVPGIFNQIDGLSSHSYPNPGFSQPPNTISLMGTGSFLYERQLVMNMTRRQLPVFITETGWTADTVSDEKRAEYYKQALQTIWNDKNIVAITPFLLQSGGGPFQQFTFIGPNGYLTKQYQALREYPKVKGLPVMSMRVLGAGISREEQSRRLEERDFSRYQTGIDNVPLASIVQDVFQWVVLR